MREVRLLSAGFEVVRLPSGEREHIVSWDEVVRIRAYKLDLFSYDSICLCFETGADHAVELLEEWKGFADVVAAIEKFPRIPPGWYHEVAFPPFDANERVLFER